MKRIFIGLTLFIFIIVASVFGVLFTKPGNDLIASYIENSVNKGQKDVQLKVNDFSLTFNTINFNATINDNSNIDVSGDLELFAKKVDLKYDIRIKELSHLVNLTKQKLNGSFSTKGTFKGDEKLSIINGISDVASSDTTYYLQLVDFQPSNINFSLKNANVEELLYLVNQPKFAQGILNVKGDVKNANISSLDGIVTANLQDGFIVNKIFNKAFNQNLNTKVTFKSGVNAVLTPNKITAKTATITSLASINTKETVIDLISGKITTDYKLNIKDLSLLEPFTAPQKFNGSLSTTGDVVVNNGIIKIDGKSDVAKSLTNYDLKITNGKTEYIKFDVVNAQLDKLLYMLNQPIYATGKLDIDGNIKNADIPKLDGIIKSKVTDGVLVNKVINKQFNQKLKQKVTFKANATTNLIPNQAVTKVNLLSSLANATIQKAVFDIPTASFNSDYLLNVPNLSNLSDITGQKMRGKLDLIGNLKSSKDLLSLTGNSKLLGGVLDFVLKNDNFTAKVDGIQIKQLTHMMYYPEVFDSTSALNLNYNLLTKKGQLSGDLLKGHFLKNEFSGLINQFAKFDLTREIYETVNINSDINDMVLKTVIAMKSKHTQIDVIQSILDLNKTFVDADIKAQINKLNLDFSVKGNTKSPKIKLNTKNILKNKIEDQINKKIGDNLKNKLGDEGAKDLLNNFKSLF